jgi:RNA polymerase sigma-70 factor, ECF subfamily
VRARLRLLRSPSVCLLAQAREDVEVFSAFYDAYYDRILAFIVRRVFDPEVAIDLVSETFAKALERRRQFRGQSAEQEQAWLFAIARTELSHYWRAGRSERTAIARYAIVTPTLTSEETDRIEELAGISALGDRLSRALLALPDEQRRALELRVVQERSYTEVAQLLGMAEPAVRARVSRGLRQLAVAMRDPVGDELVGDTA